MKLSSLIPSSDLLEQIENLEPALKRRLRFGRFGWNGGAIAALVATAQAVAVLYKNTPNSVQQFVDDIPTWWQTLVIATLFLFALGWWFTYWLRESRQPFRYTCSIGDFLTASSKESSQSPSPGEPKMAWLSHDLSQRLNQRVQRLLFSDPSQPADANKDSTENKTGDAHIHVDGHYILRPTTESDGEESGNSEQQGWQIVVMPRVRIGPIGSPERLAHPVEFDLEKRSKPTETSRISLDDYGKLIERVYYSVATEIYQQIRKDVEKKIALLPTRYHQAVSLYCEANDYARSNTLRSYEAASELYRRSAALFDPYNPMLRQRPRSPVRLSAYFVAAVITRIWRTSRRKVAWIRPRAAQPDLLLARAKIGYANMLLFRGILSTLLGQRLVPIYEARRFANEALREVERLPSDVPGRHDTRFAARVTLGLLCSRLSDQQQTIRYLAEAEALDPNKSNRDAGYLMACSTKALPDLIVYDTLLRASELEPRFEVVKFTKAYHREMLWRACAHPRAERREAEMVLKEYREVTQLNPGNIGAWANSGYVCWILGEKKDLEEAEKLFSHSREYKSVIPDTLVSELNYGLARVYAEKERFDDAYEHFILAENGRRAHGITHGTNVATYFFELIDTDLLQRFRRFKEQILKHDRELKKKQRGNDASKKADKECNVTSKHVRDVICAFALNDFGDACKHYANRSGDEQYIQHARKAYLQSIERNPSWVIPHYNLALLQNLEGKRKQLERVVELESNWQDGFLELARTISQDVYGTMAQAERERQTAERILEERSEKKAELRSLRARQSEFAMDFGPKEVSPLVSEHERTEIGKRIQELEEELKKLKTEVNSAKKTAEDLSQKADGWIKEAQQHAEKLLPHSWLWEERSHLRLGSTFHASHVTGNGRKFNWRALSDTRLREEARWEREFNVFHAQALYAWVTPLLRKTQTTGSGKGEDPERLLRHIEELFSPWDFAILNDFLILETDPAEKERRADQLQALVRTWLARDPAAHWALQHLDSDIGFTLVEKEELLERAHQAAPANTRISTRLSGVRRGLGDQNYGEGALDQALDYYLRADEGKTTEPEFGQRSAQLKLATIYFDRWQLTLANEAAGCADPVYYLDDVQEFLAAHECSRQLLQRWYERHQENCPETNERRVYTDGVDSLLELAARSTGTEDSEESTTTPLNVRVPIAVEIDPSMFSDPANEFIINTCMPEMRQRVEDRYGVKIPGIRLRLLEHTSTRGSYSLLIHDVIVARGTLPVPENEVPLDAAESLERFRIPIDHLEQLLQQNLAEWIRVQEVQNLLERYCNELYRVNIPAFETDGHIGPLTIIVRSLVAERVSIRDFRTIYELYYSMSEDRKALQDIVDAVRQLPTIKRNLWGNETSYQRFVLDDRFEDLLGNHLKSINGCRVLELGEDERNQVSAAISSSISPTSLCSLTVSSRELRPLLRKLIEKRLPAVPVLWVDELSEDVLAQTEKVIPAAPVDSI